VEKGMNRAGMPGKVADMRMVEEVLLLIGEP
jgi:hypothetical protein